MYKLNLERAGELDQIANIHSITEKAREFQKNIYFCFTDYAKAFACVDHKKLWKILNPGLGSFSRADRGIGGVRPVAPPTWLVSNFLVRQTQRSPEGPRHRHRIPRLSEAPWEVP